MMNGEIEMRKIEINDDIRTYAETFKSKVVSKCTKVENELLALGKYVASHNPWKDKTAVTDYIQLLVDDYPGVLTLEPKEWEKYITKYDDVLKREPTMLTTVVEYGVNKKGKPYKANLYDRIIFCLRYEEVRVILGGIHQKMGLKSCVYCNASPTIAHDRDVMYQMDHYLPQSKYPFLGTCFYNLQPSCGVCNNHKGTDISDFGLYVNAEQKKNLNPFRFVPQISLETGAFPSCRSILFKGSGLRVTNSSKAHEEMFHINNIYAEYKDRVSKLYENAYKTNDSVVQVMSSIYGFNNTKEDAIAFIANLPSLDERDIHNEPLMKLKQDTIKQMKEGGII